MATAKARRAAGAAIGAAVVLGAIACGGASGGDRETARAQRARAADTSRRSHADGERDRSDTAREDDAADHGDVVASDQHEDRDDVEITQEIRRIVTSDGRLSLGAKNVVIVTRDGVVTLRGSIEDEEERRILLEIARDVEGVRELDDELRTPSGAR